MSRAVKALRHVGSQLEAAPGQGMLEYGLLLVTVPLVVIVTVWLFGERVAVLFTTAGSSIP
jgi:Flp pilus assembly pilin Flp